MSATITRAGGATLSPLAVSEYETTRAGGNIIHVILNRADPDVSFRVPQLRTGTLKLTFTDEDDAKDAEDEHAILGAVFTVVSVDRPTVDMDYVVGPGGVRRRLELAGQWSLYVDFQEVAA